MRPRSTTCVTPALAIAAVCLVHALQPTPAAAQTAAKGSVAITSPAHGTLISSASPFYLAATEEIQVTGVVNDITQPNKFKLLVQGKPTNMVALPGGGYSFSVRIWIGPNLPGGVPGYPYLAFFTDEHHIQKPIIAELVEKKTKLVVDRDRVVLFDGRPDFSLNPEYPAGLQPQAAHVQITGSGLDALEPAHLASMPDPDLDAFNEVLRTRAEGVTNSALTDTDARHANNACVPLSPISSLFEGTSALNAVMLQAEIRFLAYEYAKDMQDSGVLAGPWAIAGWAALEAYILSECVQEQPTYDTFEVCTGSIEGEMTDLRTGGINAINLSYGPGTINAPYGVAEHVFADVDLGRIDGTVEGRLRDVFIRWSPTPGICLADALPQATVDLDVLLSDEARAEWATCHGLEVDADAAFLGPDTTFAYSNDPVTAAQDPASFTLASSGNLEMVDTAGSTGVAFTLSTAQTQSTNAGVCAGPGFIAPAVQMLELFYPDMQAALGDAWDESASATQQAVALDALFAPIEVGTYEPSDHDLTVNVTDLDGHLAEPNIGYDGLTTVFSTDAKLVSAAAIITPPTTFVYATPASNLFKHPNQIYEALLEENGENNFGDGFDIAYGITTGMLNAVLRERSASEWLRFDFTPSYEDAGATPPAGASPMDPLPLDTTTLASEVHWAFGNLGVATFTIRMAPTLLPFTWIPPDPVSTPQNPSFPGRAPLTYQMSQYVVDFISSDPLNPQPLTVLIDFYDPGFAFGFATPATNLLVPELSAPQWTVTILESNIPSCPKTPHMVNPPAGLPACERELEGALSTLIVPELESRMLALLSEVPVPQIFDAGRTANTGERRFDHQDTYYWQQRIVFYGRLQPIF